MDWKRLLQLSKDDSLENLRRNRLVFRIAKEALQNYVAGENSDDSEYDNAFVVWDRKQDYYVLVAQDSRGTITIGFDENHAKIIRDEEHALEIEVLLDNTLALLRQCIAIVDGKTKEVETIIAKEYLEEVRFGDIHYLENEFKEFVKKRLGTITEHTGKELYDHLPFKLNFKGRLKEYLEEYCGDTTNLHIIN